MIAQTIINQLGGNCFIAMTGAKQFVSFADGVQFSLPRGRKVRISLNADLYSLELFTIRTGTVRRLGLETQIYADKLAAEFSKMTGLDTHL